MGLVEIKTRKRKSVSSCLLISQEKSQEKYCNEYINNIMRAIDQLDPRVSDASDKTQDPG